MSAMTDTKSDPLEERATPAEPKVGEQESTATEASKPSTITEMASSAASTATAAAAGVKDNVFSMFGGGAKKEKKEDPEDEPEEASGSSKAKKDAEADVSPIILWKTFCLSSRMGTLLKFSVG